jgi:hypothetical protein
MRTRRATGACAIEQDRRHGQVIAVARLQRRLVCTLLLGWRIGPVTGTTGLMNLIGDRIRTHTAAEVLRRIDAGTTGRLRQFATDPPETISRRMEDLDREWDTDRVIELQAASTGLVGLALATFVDRRFLAVPAIVGAAMLLYATIGSYPLLPVIRRMGVRSPHEIGRERYALKVLRGDFQGMDGQHGSCSRETEPRNARAAEHAGSPRVAG